VGVHVLLGIFEILQNLEHPLSLRFSQKRWMSRHLGLLEVGVQTIF
jgi:hypothetical protein